MDFDKTLIFAKVRDMTFMGAQLTIPLITDLSAWLDARTSPTFITTVNPEMLLAARTNARLHSALAHADLGLVDGVGLSLVLQYKTRKTIARKTGIDAAIELAQYAQTHNITLVAIGDPTVLSLRTHDLFKTAMLIVIPKEDNYEKLYTRIINQIPETPCVVLLGLGMGKQEYSAYRLTRECQNVRVAIGVGGAFAMIAGTLPRAPLILRRLGLEWMWRLFLEPRRIGRILTAVLKFPLIAYRYPVYD